ncbi:AhpC/TSA family protein [Pedobacter frigiditerrae]|uniref:AhpC/TSA family protein n=1 Tax=Pedobacter frigiditerrae TaxID=2530452 RepID=A0A4R0ML45_9SPHI|nr:TlpA disulfide reductase family protein [Pedobacter frigiditerrae]TCC86902.1 AhpC/TSA family protein [Pedobacter frigiditerrae]
MRSVLLLIGFLIPIVAIAQSSFVIRGYGKRLKDGEKIFLSYKLPSGFIDDSTVVSKGYFEFKGSMKGFARGYICRNDNPKYAEFLRDRFEVYVEPGIAILKSADTLNNSIISGTILNNDNAILIKKLKPIEIQKRSLKDIDQFSTEELKDTSLVNKTKAKSLALSKESALIELDFINQHPNSYVSLYNLLRISKSRNLLSKVETAFSKLNGTLRELPEGIEIKRRIVESKKIQIGMQSIDFEQPTPTGNMIKLSAYKGKYLLIDFWASWCLPCREENPNVIAAYNTFKNMNFTVLSISIDVLADKAKWLQAIKDDQLPWTQVSDLKKENTAAKIYGVTTIPSNVMIDPTGKVIAKDLKGKELIDFLSKTLSAN